MIQRNAYRFALLALCLASVACGDKASEGGAGTGPAAGSGGSATGGTGGAAAGNGGSPSGGSGGDGASGMSAGMDAPPLGGIGGVGGNAGNGDEMPMLEPNTPWADVPEQCKGFEVVGLTASPGGDVLPNICAPFHGTFNNPYAIRCVDADPAYDTGFLGDEWCILPPPVELGTQIHVGPEDYSNIDPAFLLAVGDEKNDYFYVNAPNTEEHFYYRTNWRMRSGSHHMIINLIEEREDGWATVDFGGGLGGNTRSFGGAQRPDQDRPQGTLAVPPENDGLGARLRAQDQFSFNLHHFNMTESETLREAWVNVWYKPEAEVTQEMQGIAIFGNPADLNIPPGEHRELIYSCDVSGSTRVITLNGHRHKSTDRFGVWLTRSGETETIPIYESFQYTDMPTYQYDSVSMNPVPDLMLKHDGGFSGMLELNPGDKVTFVCDVTNHNDVALRFANEVETGEMCILFGSRTGDPLCGAGTREN